MKSRRSTTGDHAKPVAAPERPREWRYGAGFSRRRDEPAASDAGKVNARRLLQGRFDHVTRWSGLRPRYLHAGYFGSVRSLYDAGRIHPEDQGCATHGVREVYNSCTAGQYIRSSTRGHDEHRRYECRSTIANTRRSEIAEYRGVAYFGGCAGRMLI